MDTSHSAANSEYAGAATTSLQAESFLLNEEFLGYDIAAARVATSENGYEVVVEFAKDINVEEATDFVESFATYITYRLSYDGNHVYGSAFVNIDYASFFLENGDGLRDHLNIKIDRNVRLSDLKTSGVIHELTHFYYRGMQSNNIKSKYFNLFLILEAVEGSAFYRGIFEDGTMFSDQEKQQLQDVANKMPTDQKKSVVLSVLSRTAIPRHAKLLEVLKRLGVQEVRTLKNTDLPLTIEIIKALIDARNKLFHKGNQVDENLIWASLLPLTRNVISVLETDPLALTRCPPGPVSAA